MQRRTHDLVPANGEQQNTILGAVAPMGAAFECRAFLPAFRLAFDNPPPVLIAVPSERHLLFRWPGAPTAWRVPETMQASSWLEPHCTVGDFSLYKTITNPSHVLLCLTISTGQEFLVKEFYMPRVLRGEYPPADKMGEVVTVAPGEEPAGRRRTRPRTERPGSRGARPRRRQRTSKKYEREKTPANR